MPVINSKWDGRFMKIAREISTWSKDPSSQIGAVIVNDDRRILATGYNGFPRGIADTEERLNDREQKYPRIVHAELNALMNSLYSGVSVKDATLYVWGLPVCSECTKSVIQSGIGRIVITYPEYAPEKWQKQWNELSRPMFEEAGVSMTFVNPYHWSIKEADEKMLRTHEEAARMFAESGIRSF
jgi:dCMP deaminase